MYGRFPQTRCLQSEKNPIISQAFNTMADQALNTMADQLTTASAMLLPGQRSYLRSYAVQCRCLWKLGAPGS